MDVLDLGWGLFMYSLFIYSDVIEFVNMSVFFYVFYGFFKVMLSILGFWN